MLPQTKATAFQNGVIASIANSIMLTRKTFHLLASFACSILLCFVLSGSLIASPETQSPADIHRSASRSARTLLKAPERMTNTDSQRLRSKEDRLLVSGSTIRVWNPHSKSCRGQFNFHPKNRHGLKVMVREAAVDLRHNSLRELHLKLPPPDNTPFRRICILVTASQGVGHVEPAPLSSLGDKKPEGVFPEIFLKADGDTLSNQFAAGWSVDLDYILKDPICRNRCPKDKMKLKDCRPGEWQIIATLRPPAHIRSDRALQRGLDWLMHQKSATARLELKLPVFLAYENDKVLDLTFTVGLSCISGLESQRSLENVLPRMPRRSANCREATGSVNVAGGALWGYKRTNPAGRREIANFAARSLLGPVRYDTVAVPVIGKYSISEIMSRCRNDELCYFKYHEENEHFMRELALEVEDELKLLKFPTDLWQRIALFPVCRLGTDFDDSEKDSQGCTFSRYHGQGAFCLPILPFPLLLSGNFNFSWLMFFANRVDNLY